mmetsp:Transcript_45117/g.115404  ORF Transcript_45117/g.115404 Transcript_45117/m.115404 type:complete len:205 (+) Transcript_45117:1072-1686(+)
MADGSWRPQARMPSRSPFCSLRSWKALGRSCRGRAGGPLLAWPPPPSCGGGPSDGAAAPLARMRGCHGSTAPSPPASGVSASRVRSWSGPLPHSLALSAYHSRHLRSWPAPACARKGGGPSSASSGVRAAMLTRVGCPCRRSSLDCACSSHCRRRRTRLVVAKAQRAPAARAFALANAAARSFQETPCRSSSSCARRLRAERRQ